jgi:hypothetical protein
MPKLEEIKSDNSQIKSDNNHSSLNQPNQKEESSIIKTIGQLLPFAPLVFEQFTGQKIPALSGTMAEIQLALTNLQTGLQTIANNQQSLNQRLISLENNANNHLTNLTNQFNSLRLTHTKEKKEIAYNNPPLEQNNEDY